MSSVVTLCDMSSANANRSNMCQEGEWGNELGPGLQGVARALLRACEDAAAGAGTTRLCLMARAGDERAVTLYHSAGYEFCGQDGSRWWQRLLFMVPKVLMCKAL